MNLRKWKICINTYKNKRVYLWYTLFLLCKLDNLNKSNVKITQLYRDGNNLYEGQSIIFEEDIVNTYDIIVIYSLYFLDGYVHHQPFFILSLAVSQHISSPNDLFMISFGKLNGNTSLTVKNIHSSIKNSLGFLYIFGIKL